MKKLTTWILIANGSEARVYAAADKNADPQAVDGMDFSIERKSAGDIMADRQGRSFNSVGGQRHAMEYPSDPAELLQEAFADELCDALGAAQSAGTYDRLAVVAPPAMLAKIRKALPQNVHNSVYADLDKDYTELTVRELAGMLRKHELIA